MQSTIGCTCHQDASSVSYVVVVVLGIDLEGDRLHVEAAMGSGFRQGHVSIVAHPPSSVSSRQCPGRPYVASHAPDTSQ